MPEDDDRSEDEFKGYLDDDDVITGGADTTDHPTDSSMNSTQADDDAGCQPIPDFEQPVGYAEGHHLYNSFNRWSQQRR